jgi:uncharacterized Zn-binding protein involved in type VI secretion
MRAIGRVGDLRACGAIIISTFNTSVFANNKLIATLHALDSHGGNALTSSAGIFIENLPIITLGDPNDCCKWVTPKHYSQPLVTGDFDVYGD